MNSWMLDGEVDVGIIWPNIMPGLYMKYLAKKVEKNKASPMPPLKGPAKNNKILQGLFREYVIF